MYWEYHDNLFRNQTRWAPSTSPSGMFAEYAEQLGLDRGAFESCLNSDRHAEVVTANMELGNQLGVNGTPTIYVEQGGSARRVGNDLQALRAYIDGILAEADEGA